MNGSKENDLGQPKLILKLTLAFGKVQSGLSYIEKGFNIYFE